MRKININKPINPPFLQTAVTGSAVIQGDCLEIMETIPDCSINMILADLPYGTTQCKWDSVIDLQKMWLQYERIITPNGAIVLTAQTPFDKVLGSSNLKLLKYEWIWEKSSATGHLNAKKMPMKAHENVLVFYKKPPVYNYQKTEGHERKVSKAEHKINCKESDIYNKGQKLTNYDSTERYPRSVLKFSSDKQKSKLHPTQKPILLMEYFIKTYSNEGDIILDNTAGSGTTGIACINTNRKYILIEKEQKYIDIINERIKTYNMEK
jgi:site-specific DNA-methyltransferase (adenine-specific)